MSNLAGRKKMKKLISIITIILILCTSFSAYSQNAPWNCPSCGRTSNTGNFCGGCGHVAPWKETPPTPYQPPVTPVPVPSIQLGDTVQFGYYEQDGNLSNGPEPVEWIVLENYRSDGSYLLLSVYALDMQRYNSRWTSINWERCSVRSWLNSTFYNTCFSAQEQQAIVPATNYSNYGNNTIVTNDSVFFLSADEVQMYFSSAADRKAQPTAYAVGQKTVEKNGACWWWLRGSSQRTSDADSIKYTGEVMTYGTNTNSLGFGIRPAIRVHGSYFLGY